LPTTYPYGCGQEWASIYSSDQSAQFGALFIEFNLGADPNRAHGYFKNVAGQVIDEFWGTASDVPVDIHSVAITEHATEDANVEEDSPGENFGSETQLKVDGSPIETTYLKFDLTGIASERVLSAKLRLMVTNPSSSLQDLRMVDDDSWDETTITFDSRPATGQKLTTLDGGDVGSWVEVNVTSTVRAEAGGMLSLAVDSSGTDGLDFNSKEAPDGWPELAMVLTDESPALIPALGPLQRLALVMLLMATTAWLRRRRCSHDSSRTAAIRVSARGAGSGTR
ncbi:MAG: DNRLRE domain-containing protein, partial [Deltaproteobacteria bacterium]|nr:DNRLRE domain-containing protein [Deltaproteobacteria bacterium]